MLVFRRQDLLLHTSLRCDGDKTVSIAKPITIPITSLAKKRGTTLKITMMETNVSATATKGASDDNFRDDKAACSCFTVTRSM